MGSKHQYEVTVRWTGNTGSGSENYASYKRDHTITAAGKAEISASSDPKFRGDKNRYNPEELLVSSLSSCHMLWYLHLCSENGVVVTAYADNAIGLMIEDEDGGGCFSSVTLRPHVVVTDEKMIKKAVELHKAANEKCFIANSCNFPVKHIASCIVERN